MSIKFGDVTVDAAYNTHYDFVFVRWLIVVVVVFVFFSLSRLLFLLCCFGILYFGIPRTAIIYSQILR